MERDEEAGESDEKAHLPCKLLESRYLFGDQQGKCVLYICSIKPDVPKNGFLRPFLISSSDMIASPVSRTRIRKFLFRSFLVLPYLITR